MTLTDVEVQRFIIDALEQNFELLKLESGHSLAADVKATALNQALLYWLKLKDIAIRVTETEVRLNLPGRKTAQGRKFGIEGVVDIVKEADRTVMYDIKTHDADQVRDHIEGYEDQLNIYAFIWQNSPWPASRRDRHHCHCLPRIPSGTRSPTRTPPASTMSWIVGNRWLKLI